MTQSARLKKIVVFNLLVDEDSHVLAAAVDWIQEFSKHCEKLIVITTHKGTWTERNNIYVYAVSGGSAIRRLVAITKLFYFAMATFKRSKPDLVFHHMSPRTGAIVGPLFRLFGVKQGLWYSHSSKPLSLRVATCIVDSVFSSNKESFPFECKKLKVVGHGINQLKFGKSAIKSGDERRDSILFLGRLSRIKNIEALINAVGQLKVNLPIDLIGPQTDLDYLRLLKHKASVFNVNIQFFRPIAYDEVSKALLNYSMFYSGMVGSADKSAVEAAMQGCFIISTDLATAKATGMYGIWLDHFNGFPATVEAQIALIRSLDKSKLWRLRLKLAKSARENNDLTVTIERIVAGILG